ncbi:hypothetical protein [Limnospira platensis]|uniref:hypothetical protein n=1 Tax=Limnospira platensis TaxID=118562 RepID=UPI0002803E5C|nr:hypothetical protein SPLC1_S533500 [Arthrospira platensis C1]UWU48765.1 hypothetical protein APLC1_3569 [Arthrospira platensis C1]
MTTKAHTHHLPVSSGFGYGKHPDFKLSGYIRQDRLQRLSQKGIIITPSELDEFDAYTQKIRRQLLILKATSVSSMD